MCWVPEFISNVESTNAGMCTLGPIRKASSETTASRAGNKNKVGRLRTRLERKTVAPVLLVRYGPGIYRYAQLAGPSVVFGDESRQFLRRRAEISRYSL